jgi:flagellar basal-body rod modification protein FlgD
MTSITSATSSSSTANSVSGTSADTLAADFDTFLTLLTTQLQNQDPLDPTDTTEFTSQLVQFASVEQQINTNSNLETLISLQEAEQSATAVSYLGSRVEYDGGTVALQDGYSEFSYSLGENAANVVISIFDSSNKLVTSTTGTTSAGDHEMIWDGTDKDGNKVSDGTYTVKVSAFDATNNTVDTTVSASGVVTGVTTGSDGEVMLKMGNHTVGLTDVTGIREGTGMTDTELSAWGTVTSYLSDLVDGVDSIKEATTSTSSSAS